MFGLGAGELIVILAIITVLFGASRLPQLGEGMGKALRGFKRAVSDDGADAPAPAARIERPATPAAATEPVAAAGEGTPAQAPPPAGR